MKNLFKETVFCDRIEIIGLKTLLTESQKMNYKIITDQWKKFNYDLHRIIGRTVSSAGWVKYGITYKENKKYNYLACIPYDPKFSYPSNMIRKIITAGYYALFRYTGKMTDINKTVSYIFKKAIPSENLNTGNIEKSGIILIEKYDKRFNWNKSGSIIDLLVPVIK